MSTGPADGETREFELTEANTFSFMPGRMAGVTCPSCFCEMLLKEAIAEGECNSCGTELSVTLTVKPE